MRESMQDGMSYVHKYGTADLFITFTCNTKWKEITDALLLGQKAQNRYDVVGRVFRLKLMKLKKLIQKKIFGETVCYMSSIE